MKYADIMEDGCTKEKVWLWYLGIGSKIHERLRFVMKTIFELNLRKELCIYWGDKEEEALPEKENYKPSVWKL